MDDGVVVEAAVMVEGRDVWPRGPGGWGKPMPPYRCTECNGRIRRSETCWRVTHGPYVGQYHERLNCLPHIPRGEECSGTVARP